MKEIVKNKKDIITNTIWVRWVFAITLIPLIVFLSTVVFNSPDKDKIVLNAFFHFLFIFVYNIIHTVIVDRQKKGKPLNTFLKVWQPFLEYLILDNIAIAWGIYYSGGLASPILYVYFISVIFTAAAYHKKTIFFIGSLSFFLYNILFWFDYTGVVNSLKFYPASFSGVYDNFIIAFFINFSFNITLIVAVFLSILISQTINEREKEIIFGGEKIKYIIRNFVDGLIMLDNQNIITLINPKAEKVLGIKKEEVVGKKVTLEMFSQPKFQNLSRVVLIKEEAKDVSLPEINVEKPEKAHLQVVSASVFDINRNVIGSMKILHDITREKEIDRLKSEFISIAAHQLRTPLSAVKWTFKMMIGGDFGKINPEQKDFLERGYNVNERMIALVNDLLNVSRIEEGKFNYNFKLVSLEEIINNLIDVERGRIEEKKIKFIFKKSQEQIPKIRGDAEKLGLAIQNILDNATHYTPSGGEINVSIRHSGDDLVLEVSDTGVGVPKEQFERLFTKFFRANNVVRMQTEGTGLGLYISKNIIERHGGKILIKSEEGKGTSVFISLPAGGAESEFSEFVQNLSGKSKSEKEFEKFIKRF